MPVSNLQGVSPKSVRCVDAAGSLKRHFLVQGANPHEAVRPGGANVRPLGLAIETVGPGQHVGIQNFGEAVVVAASAFAVDAPLNIADTQGRVKAVSEAAGVVVNLVGYARSAASAAGDHVTVDLQFGRYTA